MIRALVSRPGAKARIAANRAALRFVNGVEWFRRDPASVVGQTPWEPILEREKLVVRRYRRPGAPRHAVPVLLIPPLMVKPFIFDLREGRSLAGHLLDAGFAVYLVDFGEPDEADAYVRLDDYVLDWVPAAVEAVAKDAGAAGVSLLGYCMGGLFALCHTAANADERVKNIVTVASPVDTHKMGLLAWVARTGGDQIEGIARRLGNVPGGLSSTAFRLLAPRKNVTRYADLFMNMWDQEYVNGFDAMHAWVSQFIDYPQEAFVQFFSEFMRHNKLAQGTLEFGGKPARLSAVKSSLLAFAGDTDQVVPAPAAEAVIGKIGSDDAEYRLAPGGHMGVFAGSRAPEHVWEPAAAWLAERSGGGA